MSVRLQIDIAVFEDWRQGARRTISLEAESLEELEELAIDVANGVAALARKVVAEQWNVQKKGEEDDRG